MGVELPLASAVVLDVPSKVHALSIWPASVVVATRSHSRSGPEMILLSEDSVSPLKGTMSKGGGPALAAAMLWLNSRTCPNAVESCPSRLSAFRLATLVGELTRN